MNDEIRALISAKAEVSKLKAAAVRNGMLTLREAVVRKLFQGVTTVEEVVRVTRSDVG